MLSNLGSVLIFFILSLSLFIIYNSYLDIETKNQSIKKKQRRVKMSAKKEKNTSSARLKKNKIDLSTIV